MRTFNGILERNDAIASGSALAPTAQLDATEKARLQELEAIVEQGLQTFYEVGKALDEIREQKLYRATHKTFEAYCRDRWRIGKSTAYRYIDAAHVMENLSPIGEKIPRKENQVRPLTQLPPALQLEIWQEAVELAPNGIPSAAVVQRLVDEKVSGGKTRRGSQQGVAELEQLRLENQHLKEQIKQRDLERERRTAEVAAELERLRAENRQLRAELAQRDRDWEARIALERQKISAEIKAEYESLIQQLTANYQAVLAKLEAIEGKN